MKKLGEIQGITLVALVVTIIILLILAGISIASLTGNGLFGKAKLAKEKQENVEIEEDEILGDYENAIHSAVAGSREEIMVDKDEYAQLLKDVANLKRNSTNNNYSTEEQIVGTWIDGRPIYRKTYTGQVTDADYDTIATIENLDIFLGIDSQASYVIKNDGNQRITTTLYSFLIKNGNKIQLTWNRASDFSIGNSYAFTIQYTKTTDTAKTTN